MKLLIPHNPFRFAVLLACLTFVVSFSLTSAAQGNDPNSPTASVNPSEIDAVWQKATAKYAAARAAILDRVDQTNVLGRETVGEQNVQSVELGGSSLPLSFQQSADVLRVSLPEKPDGKYAYVFRIRFASAR